jgi:hypothetical protein
MLQMVPRSLLAASLAAFALPVLAANPPSSSAHHGAGLYSDYNEPGITRFDKFLGDAGPMPMNELLPWLLGAVDQLSKYPRPKALPAIHRVPRSLIEDLVCAGECGVLATYRPGEGVYMDERMRPETNLFDRSVLLHELVHYVQDLANERGEMEACKRWYYREQEAYAIQKQFLMLVGSPVRVGYSANRSTCDESVEERTAKSLYEAVPTLSEEVKQ